VPRYKAFFEIDSKQTDSDTSLQASIAAEGCLTEDKECPQRLKPVLHWLLMYGPEGRTPKTDVAVSAKQAEKTWSSGAYGL
jgi:hypothetical protein